MKDPEDASIRIAALGFLTKIQFNRIAKSILRVSAPPRWISLRHPTRKELLQKILIIEHRLESRPIYIALPALLKVCRIEALRFGKLVKRCALVTGQVVDESQSNVASSVVRRVFLSALGGSLCLLEIVRGERLERLIAIVVRQVQVEQPA